MTEQPPRLTPQRLASIRRAYSGPTTDPTHPVRLLLAEVDALTAERDHWEWEAANQAERLATFVEALRKQSMRTTNDGWVECSLCRGARRLLGDEITRFVMIGTERHADGCLLADRPPAVVIEEEGG